MGYIDVLIITASGVATLVAIFMASRLAKDNSQTEAIAGRSLGPMMLAISAGAASTSGVVLTGMVGLGYSFGLVWCLMMIGWLLGDIVFWTCLAKRLHKKSVESKAVSLPSLVSQQLYNQKHGRWFCKGIGLLVVALMIPYATAQWLAAGKMGGMLFEFPVSSSAYVFALVVIGYTAIAGVRGAVYTDFVQGLMMLLLAAAATVMVVNLLASADSYAAVPDGFLSLTGNLTSVEAALTLLGFAGLAVAFNLGQPHMVNRWLSAESGQTLARARWVYIGFVQLLYLGFTALGAIIRLVLETPDPEQALVAMFKAHAFPGAIGLLVAGSVATIASTASAIVAVCAELLRGDVIRARPSRMAKALSVTTVGLLSVAAIAFSDGGVFNTAITAVSLLGATLAAPMLFTIFNQRMTSWALCLALMAGFGVGSVWVISGLNTSLNEAGPGMLAGLLVLWLMRRKTTS